MPQGASDASAAYPPLDTLKLLAEAVWIVDSGPIHVLGLPLPIRMTVLRLSNGDMLLHSPTGFNAGLMAEIQRIGPIRHLVAPNIAHWMYLKDWQDACPDALVWAPPGLRKRGAVRRSGLRIDHDLGAAAPPAWSAEIEQVVVPGAGFQEIAFFHRPSRTLVLTDLVVNIEPEKLPRFARPAAGLLGVLAPNGRAPAYVRLLFLAKRREAGGAAARLVALSPERVVFAHGLIFDRAGTQALKRSLAWLLPGAA